MKIYDMHIHGGEATPPTPEGLLENFEKAGVYGGVISLRNPTILSRWSMRKELRMSLVGQRGMRTDYFLFCRYIPERTTSVRR